MGDWGGEHTAAHLELLGHWRDTLGEERVVEVCYDSLVREPEAELRRLLQKLQLPWQPALLDWYLHHSDPHPAFSPDFGSTPPAGRPSCWACSAQDVEQAREPLHSRTVGKWKNYDERKLQ